jgi:hypothetical protein
MAHQAKLGLALAAILILSTATITATAQAAPEFLATEAQEAESTEEEAPVHATLDATTVEAEPIKFTLGSFSVTCAKATATATLEAPSSTTTLSPSFGECKMVILGVSFAAEVSPGSCGFVIHATEEIEADVFKANTDISCPGEGKIQITIKNLAQTKTKCVVHVPPQSGLNTTKIKDMTEASPANITVAHEIEGASATVTNGEENCWITPGNYNTGKLTGNTTVTATNGGEVPPLRMVDTFHFADEEEEVAFIATQYSGQEFGFDLGKVKCGQIWLEGDHEFPGKTSPELAGREPSGEKPYQACTFNKEETEVDLWACRFRITALRVEAGQYEAGTYIEQCVPKRTIEVITPNCTIKIPEQMGYKKEGLRTVTLTNVGTGTSREVIAQFNVKGMKYEEEGGGCKQAGQLTSNGTYSGSIRLTVAERAGPWFRGLWVEKT